MAATPACGRQVGDAPFKSSFVSQLPLSNVSTPIKFRSCLKNEIFVPHLLRLVGHQPRLTAVASVFTGLLCTHKKF